ncbi:MAG: hypothetical protein DCC57_13675, partial [Chloroflexi bacterium]
GKYRIASARWATWDYGRNAAYFVTICTQGRAHHFGQIANRAMTLSPLGQAAWDCWSQIPDHFPFVRLGAFVVMPNHVHGIIVIDKPVETQDFASLRPTNQFGPQSKNLASIVRGYKIGVTKFARQHEIPFGWQPRYYDRVIRDADEYARIERYIQTNPENWQTDSLFGEQP